MKKKVYTNFDEWFLNEQAKRCNKNGCFFFDSGHDSECLFDAARAVARGILVLDPADYLEEQS